MSDTPKNQTREELEKEILDLLCQKNSEEAVPFISASDPEFLQICNRFWTIVWEEDHTLENIVQRIQQQAANNPALIANTLKMVFQSGTTAGWLIDYYRVNKQFATDPEVGKRIREKLDNINKSLKKNQTDNGATPEDPDSDQIPDDLMTPDQKAAALLSTKKPK